MHSDYWIILLSNNDTLMLSSARLSFETKIFKIENSDFVPFHSIFMKSFFKKNSLHSSYYVLSID